MATTQTSEDYLLRIAQTMKGKSIFTVIPKKYVETLGISKGDKLKMQLTGEVITISKAVLS